MGMNMLHRLIIQVYMKVVIVKSRFMEDSLNLEEVAVLKMRLMIDVRQS
jgi:hypothetical protein